MRLMRKRKSFLFDINCLYISIVIILPNWYNKLTFYILKIKGEDQFE